MAITFDNIYNPNEHKLTENYTFQGVDHLYKKMWTINISAYEIAKLWDEQKIIYYPATQRGLLAKKQADGTFKYKAVFNKTRVKSIQKKILQEKYFPDQLTINILDENGKEGKVIYDEYTSQLTIILGLMCMQDGQHRTKAIHNIYQDAKIIGGEDENRIIKILKTLKFPVLITCHNMEVAMEHFWQLNLHETLSKSRIESFNKQDAVNRIMIKLNEKGALKNKIDMVKTSIAKNDMMNIVTLNTLVTAFKNTFSDIEDKNMEEECFKFLKEFFEELVKIYPEMMSYEGRKMSKEISLTCENFMFYAYLGLAHNLYLWRHSNWKKKMQCIKYIDMDKGSSIWSRVMRETSSGLSIINNTSTRRTLKDIYLEQFAIQQQKQ
ncbi:DNA-sulfur modification-associated family protein [Clostridioides difficile DA00129]|nr:DNA-sulfur modification-associated family protein [Clostridioides difficile]EQG38366.1 DNA-sulfur modification-associated family protein [Clostridioides difficile DA00129]